MIQSCPHKQSMLWKKKDQIPKGLLSKNKWHGWARHLLPVMQHTAEVKAWRQSWEDSLGYTVRERESERERVCVMEALKVSCICKCVCVGGVCVQFEVYVLWAY